MNISAPAASQHWEGGDCLGRVGHLPPDSFALFILDFAEPLIIKNQPVWIIGREYPTPDKNLVLDMSRYGDMAQGISRQHAQIHYANNVYFIEDLSSTNGTWLNRSRLTPGQSYPLRNNDQIWLGPLKLLFCAGPASKNQPVTFLLRQANSPVAPGQLLSPSVMLTELAPYLRALEQLEEVRAACLQEAAEPMYVTLIEDKAEHIQIQMVGLFHVAPLLEKWVLRWRDEHLEMVNAAHTHDPVWQEQLRPLATRIVEFLQPTAAADDLLPFVDAFIPPLSRLVSSSFEFSLL